MEAFAALLRSAPAATLHLPRLDLEGYGKILRHAAAERFVLDAAGTIELAPGMYTLRIISDDGGERLSARSAPFGTHRTSYRRSRDRKHP